MSVFSVFGTISPPSGTVIDQGESIITFLNKIISLLYTVGGLLVLVNIISAGYKYITAEGEANKLEQAGNTILYSTYGLALIAASFIVAAIIGKLFFDDTTALIQPKFEFLP
ncbi:MAG: hypothetical protein U9Q63_00395 [Patescibacteria group bacterium]|nr:hypothetical protein [Patescibacteria group bacterium]